MENVFTISSFVFNMAFEIVKLLAKVGLIILGIIKIIQFIKKNDLAKIKNVLLVSVVCIIIATLSLVLNMGWFRFAMIFVLIPIIHPILFLAINLYTSQYFSESRRLRVTNTLFVVTYLIFWILLPDGGDVLPAYCLFNLVHNDTFARVAFAISGIAGIAHMVFLILQIIQFVKLKNK